MAKELRYYQREAIDSIYNYFEKNNGNPLVSMATGVGKAFCIVQFCKEAIEQWPDTNIINITSVKELVRQNYEEMIELWPEADATIYSAGLKKKNLNGKIIFAGIQSIYKHAFKIPHKIDLVIIDECFTGDTMIKTPSGEKRIDQLKIGDIVLNACGHGKITKLYSSLPTQLVQLEMSNGRIIKSTPNHPFFTTNGWKEAAKLEIGENLFSEKTLSLLWQGYNTLDKKRRKWKYYFCNLRKRLDKAEILRELLLSETHKPNEQSCSKNEAEGKSQKDKTFSNKKRGEWSPSSHSSISFITRTWGRMASRISNKNSCWSFEWNLSKLLQSGYRKRAIKDSNRSGWWQSLQQPKKRNGRKEGFSSEQIRLEGLSYLKRESIEPVFNIQVSGHPSYFANGVLVHNCQDLPEEDETMYRKFINDLKLANPYLKVIGFTATPYRLGQGLLTDGNNPIFNDIIYDYGIIQGINDGFLSNLISKEMETKFDISKVGTRKKEYIQSQLDDAVNKDDINKAVVDELMIYGKTRKCWLAFCVTIDHATKIRDEIRSRGITCETIHSKISSEERDRILRDYSNGLITCLTNVGVMTKGTNIPRIDMIAFLRPTKSAGFVVQAAGRGTRLFPDKTDCLLLDYAGILHEHGPIDLITAKRVTSGDGVAPVKTCPGCKTILFAGTMECPDCGFIFERESVEKKIKTSAAIAPALSTQIKPEWKKVTHCLFFRHKKEGKPDSLRVEYLCGPMYNFREWKCFEHSGRMRENACNWWIDAGGKSPSPNTVTEALNRTAELSYPKYIAVRKTGKYHEITGYKWDEIEENIDDNNA